LPNPRMPVGQTHASRIIDPPRSPSVRATIPRTTLQPFSTAKRPSSITVSSLNIIICTAPFLRFMNEIWSRSPSGKSSWVLNHLPTVMDFCVCRNSIN